MSETSLENALLPPGTQIDLNNCDREPIHIPGNIQPHGILLSLHPDDLTILQASANLAAFCNADVATIVGQPIQSLLGDASAARLRELAASDTITDNPVFAFQAPLAGSADNAPSAWVLHRIHGVLIREGDPAARATARDPTLNLLTRRAIPRLQSAPDLPTLYQVAAEEVRALTGFDRVMVYRFDEEGHGTVVAEDKREDLEPFLNLHYPATDIPKQARRLYILNHLRLIADIGYVPSPVLPAANPVTKAPLDMTYCSLRSVSPIHVEYLTNMGVAASMSISVVKDGALWGLIACHHYSGPRYLPFDVRSACELLGQVVTLQLTAKSDSVDGGYREHIYAVQNQLVEKMATEEDFWAGLHSGTPNVCDLIACGGCALLLGNNKRCFLIGKTPTEAQVTALAAFVQARDNAGEVFVTDHLSALMPNTSAFKEVASGLLALPFGQNPRNYLFWFRPEVIQTVSWAGNPDKVVTVEADGSERLSPRKSFEKWQAEVRDRSLPWKTEEIEGAKTLGRAIESVILSKAEELARLNNELQRSNAELDSFAYVASHDLKEPLRGIHNYAQFLQEDHGDELPAEARAKLETITRLSVRMETLIDSLLQFSRVGRLELMWDDTDLNHVVDDTLESLRARLSSVGATVTVPRPLPTDFRCDPVQVGEVFGNLVSNAAKYNNNPAGERTIEIGYIASGEEAYPRISLMRTVPDGVDIFYVRDNGIGIAEKHHDTIFRIFRRLHGRTEYGGGTGAGLTIVQKIVERHGGHIWLESEPDAGTTFYFTLSSGKSI